MIDDSDFAVAGLFTVPGEDRFLKAPYECQRMKEILQPIADIFLDFRANIAFAPNYDIIGVQPIRIYKVLTLTK